LVPDDRGEIRLNIGACIASKERVVIPSQILTCKRPDRHVPLPDGFLHGRGADSHIVVAMRRVAAGLVPDEHILVTGNERKPARRADTHIVLAVGTCYSGRVTQKGVIDGGHSVHTTSGTNHRVSDASMHVCRSRIADCRTILRRHKLFSCICANNDRLVEIQRSSSRMRPDGHRLDCGPHARSRTTSDHHTICGIVCSRACIRSDRRVVGTESILRIEADAGVVAAIEEGDMLQLVYAIRLAGQIQPTGVHIHNCLNLAFIF